MNFIKTIFTAVVSYAAAAMLSSHVSMDLAQTHWSSLWTYFWWAVSLPVVSGFFVLVMMSVFGIFSAFKNF